MTERIRTGARLAVLLVFLLAAGPIRAAQDYDSLQTAANNGDLATFKKLLAKTPGAPKAKGAKYLATLLVCAAWGGNRDIALTVLCENAGPARLLHNVTPDRRHWLGV